MTSVQRQAGWQESDIDQNYGVAWIPGVQVASGIVHIGRGVYEIARDLLQDCLFTADREAPPLVGRVAPLYEGLERIGRGIGLIVAGSLFYVVGFGLVTCYLLNKLDRRRSFTSAPSGEESVTVSPPSLNDSADGPEVTACPELTDPVTPESLLPPSIGLSTPRKEGEQDKQRVTRSPVLKLRGAPLTKEPIEVRVKKEKWQLLLHYLEGEAELEMLTSTASFGRNPSLERRLEKRRMSSLSYVERQLAFSKRLQQIGNLTKCQSNNYQNTPLPHVSMEELAEELGMTESRLKVCLVGHVYAKKAMEKRKELAKLLADNKNLLPSELWASIAASSEKSSLRNILDGFYSLDLQSLSKKDCSFLEKLQEEMDQAAFEELERRYQVDLEAAGQELHQEGKTYGNMSKETVNRSGDRFSLDLTSYLRKTIPKARETLNGLLLAEHQVAEDKQYLACCRFIEKEEMAQEADKMRELMRRICQSPRSFASPQIALELQQLINQWEGIASLAGCRKEATNALNRVVGELSLKGFRTLEQHLYTLDNAQLLQEALKRSCYRNALANSESASRDSQANLLAVDRSGISSPYSSNQGTVKEKAQFIIKQLEEKIKIVNNKLKEKRGVNKEKIDFSDVESFVKNHIPFFESLFQETRSDFHLCFRIEVIQVLEMVEKKLEACLNRQRQRLERLNDPSRPIPVFAEAVHAAPQLENLLSISSSAIEAQQSVNWGAFVSVAMLEWDFGWVALGLPGDKVLENPIASFFVGPTLEEHGLGIRYWAGLEDSLVVDGALREVKRDFDERMAIALNRCLQEGGYSPEDSLAMGEPLLLLIRRATQFRQLKGADGRFFYQLYKKQIRNLFKINGIVDTSKGFNTLISTLIDYLCYFPSSPSVVQQDFPQRLQQLNQFLTSNDRLYGAFLGQEGALQHNELELTCVRWQANLSRSMVASNQTKKIQGVLIVPDDEELLFRRIKTTYCSSRAGRARQFCQPQLKSVSAVRQELIDLGYEVDDWTIIPYFEHLIEQQLLAERELLVPLPASVRKRLV